MRGSGVRSGLALKGGECAGLLDTGLTGPGALGLGLARGGALQLCGTWDAMVGAGRLFVHIGSFGGLRIRNHVGFLVVMTGPVPRYVAFFEYYRDHTFVECGEEKVVRITGWTWWDEKEAFDVFLSY